MSHLDFSDLETAPQDIPIRAERPEQKLHKCEKCLGKGRVTFGYVRISSGKCFKCNGTGYFKTSAATRQANRKSAAVRTANKAANNLEAFAAEHPAIAQWFADNRVFDFAVSLRQSVEKYGRLTEKQAAAAYKCVAATADRAQQREQKAEQTQINMADLLHRFDLALQAGAKRPKINTGDLLFSLAPATGKNAGHIYVKGDKDSRGERTYLGKISPEGKLYAGRDCSDVQKARIVEIGADVVKAAKAHGHQHGNCCFCSKDLKTNASVSAGYGPDCAEKYGLPWGDTSKLDAAKAELKNANEEAAA